MYFEDEITKVKFDTDNGSNKVGIINAEGIFGLSIYTKGGRIELYFEDMDSIYTFARTIINLLDKEGGK